MATKSALPVRLVLVEPPGGVDFGVQYGRGATYEPRLVQRRTQGDVAFDFELTVTAEGPPNFTGPYAQGPASARFVYVDVGTYAGQKDTPWSRRMKIPLQGITRAAINRVLREPGLRLVARIPGTGKDGGPSCATVKPLGTWKIVRT